MGSKFQTIEAAHLPKILATFIQFTIARASGETGRLPLICWPTCSSLTLWCIIFGILYKPGSQSTCGLFNIENDFTLGGARQLSDVYVKFCFVIRLPWLYPIFSLPPQNFLSSPQGLPIWDRMKEVFWVLVLQRRCHVNAYLLAIHAEVTFALLFPGFLLFFPAYKSWVFGALPGWLSSYAILHLTVSSLSLS
jgi:hypothetical protein